MHSRSSSRILASLALLVLAIPAARASEERADIYPFDVKVGGQLARVEGDHPIFARVAEPVAPDAPVEVGVEPGMVIMNAFPSNAGGEVENGVQPAIYLVQGGNSTTLDRTMTQQPLAPGTYLMNVVAAGRTARVLFEVASPAAP